MVSTIEMENRPIQLMRCAASLPMAIDTDRPNSLMNCAKRTFHQKLRGGGFKEEEGGEGLGGEVELFPSADGQLFPTLLRSGCGRGGVRPLRSSSSSSSSSTCDIGGGGGGGGRVRRAPKELGAAEHRVVERLHAGERGRLVEVGALLLRRGEARKRDHRGARRWFIGEGGGRWPGVVGRKLAGRQPEGRRGGEQADCYPAAPQAADPAAPAAPTRCWLFGILTAGCLARARIRRPPPRAFCPIAPQIPPRARRELARGPSAGRGRPRRERCGVAASSWPSRASKMCMKRWWRRTTGADHPHPARDSPRAISSQQVVLPAMVAQRSSLELAIARRRARVYEVFGART